MGFADTFRDFYESLTFSNELHAESPAEEVSEDEEQVGKNEEKEISEGGEGGAGGDEGGDEDVGEKGGDEDVEEEEEEEEEPEDIKPKLEAGRPTHTSPTSHQRYVPSRALPAAPGPPSSLACANATQFLILALHPAHSPHS